MVFQHLEIIKRIGKTKRIPYGYESKSYNYTIVGGLYNSIEIQATLMWKSLGPRVQLAARNGHSHCCSENVWSVSWSRQAGIHQPLTFHMV